MQEADIIELDNYGRSPLCITCEDGHPEVVKYLLQQGVDIKQSTSRCPFSHAIYRGLLPSWVKYYFHTITNINLGVNRIDNEGAIAISEAISET